MPRLHSIYRYPVKGLSPDPLDRVTLTPGETIPFDRAYAIENGPSRFDPAQPRTIPKISFLMLMRNEGLAALKTTFDDRDERLTVRREGATVADGRLDTDEGRRAIEAFFDEAFAAELRGPARIRFAPGHSFSDTAAKVVSLINLATVADIEKKIGTPVNPPRFRSNLYVEDMPAWAEFDLVGKTIAIGDSLLEGRARIDRCAATNVDPETGRRDLTIPESLRAIYGHPNCGVYFNVVKGGTIAIGDRLDTV